MWWLKSSSWYHRYLFMSNIEYINFYVIIYSYWYPFKRKITICQIINKAINRHFFYILLKLEETKVPIWVTTHYIEITTEDASFWTEFKHHKRLWEKVLFDKRLVFFVLEHNHEDSMACSVRDALHRLILLAHILSYCCAKTTKVNILSQNFQPTKLDGCKLLSYHCSIRWSSKTCIHQFHWIWSCKAYHNILVQYWKAKLTGVVIDCVNT